MAGRLQVLVFSALRLAVTVSSSRLQNLNMVWSSPCRPGMPVSIRKSHCCTGSPACHGGRRSLWPSRPWPQSPRRSPPPAEEDQGLLLVPQLSRVSELQMNLTSWFGPAKAQPGPVSEPGDSGSDSDRHGDSLQATQARTASHGAWNLKFIHHHSEHPGLLGALSTKLCQVVLTSIDWLSLQSEKSHFFKDSSRNLLSSIRGHNKLSEAEQLFNLSQYISPFALPQ